MCFCVYMHVHTLVGTVQLYTQGQTAIKDLYFETVSFFKNKILGSLSSDVSSYS